MFCKCEPGVSTLTIVHGNLNERKRFDAWIKILDDLRVHQVSAEYLAQKTHLSKSVVHKHLNKLVASGHILHLNHFYFLTRKGEEFCRQLEAEVRKYGNKKGWLHDIAIGENRTLKKEGLPTVCYHHIGNFGDLDVSVERVHEALGSLATGATALTGCLHITHSTC